MELNEFLQIINQLLIDDDFEIVAETTLESIDSLSKMLLINFLNTRFKSKLTYKDLDDYFTVNDLYIFLVTIK